MGSAGESESGVCVCGCRRLWAFGEVAAGDFVLVDSTYEKSGLGSLEILKKILLLHSLSGTGCSSAW